MGDYCWDSVGLWISMEIERVQVRVGAGVYGSVHRENAHSERH
jgi:hypothetical protein